MATELPKLSPAMAPGSVSAATWVQAVPARTNTYAELPMGAPTIAVVPAMVTELPKLSTVTPLGGVSSACWDQVVPERTNIYAAPVFALLNGLPTTAVDPEMATE